MIEKDSNRLWETSGAINAKQISPGSSAHCDLRRDSRRSVEDKRLRRRAPLPISRLKSQMKLSVIDDYKTQPPAAGIKNNDMSRIVAIVMKSDTDDHFTPSRSS